MLSATTTSNYHDTFDPFGLNNGIEVIPPEDIVPPTFFERLMDAEGAQLSTTLTPVNDAIRGCSNLQDRDLMKKGPQGWSDAMSILSCGALMCGYVSPVAFKVLTKEEAVTINRLRDKISQFLETERVAAQTAALSPYKLIHAYASNKRS